LNQTIDRASNHAKQCARRLALQALYQWQFTGDTPEDLVAQYQQDEFWKKSDQEYFSRLVHHCINNVKELNESIDRASDYTTDKIDPIELAALRIATFELTQSEEKLSAKIIISEAIRLSKRFGSDDGFKLVNVILDNIAKKRT
jgi:N utilization substance protein B